MTSKLFLPLIATLSFGWVGNVQADGVAGPYLAGRVASLQSDYAAAADYFTRSLVGDPANISIMENAIMSHIGVGAFEKALTISSGLDAAGAKSGLADLVVLASLAKQGQFEAAIGELDNGRSSGVLIDGLYRAWAQLGNGQMSEATTTFDAIAKQNGLAGFALYHKALALALVGDFEGADAIFADKGGAGVRLTRRSIMAHAEVLSQLERNQDAITLIDNTFGPAPDQGIAKMRKALEAGELLPFSLVASPEDGIAEVFHTVASALASEGPDSAASSQPDVLMYARTAVYLRPDLAEAVLLAAANLAEQGQHELAAATYRLIDAGAPAYVTAELGRADALIAEDRPDAAIEALQQLTKTHPDFIETWVALGDAFRRNERFEESIQSYDKAGALIDTPRPEHWIVYYARGICHERVKQWDKAEADFRQALALNPDQPQVLNYLGYSFVEMNENLDEAMSMIERAALARPDEGAIIDSLGWALYRLGRYSEAEVQMERAIELLPVDPVVNDHLGDVYWSVGRFREAEFQWKRALSFEPETDEVADRIRRKLERGLDAVLQEEGAKPLAITKNDG